MPTPRPEIWNGYRGEGTLAPKSVLNCSIKPWRSNFGMRLRVARPSRLRVRTASRRPVSLSANPHHPDSRTGTVLELAGGDACATRQDTDHRQPITFPTVHPAPHGVFNAPTTEDTGRCSRFGGGPNTQRCRLSESPFSRLSRVS